MKTVKFIAYLFYRYYSTGTTRQIAYFSTLCALVMLMYIHLAQVLIILNGMDLIPTDGSQAKIGNWVKMAVFLIPFFLLFFFLIKENALKEVSYNKQKIKQGYIFLIVYIVVSFTVMILLALYKKGKL